METNKKLDFRVNDLGDHIMSSKGCDLPLSLVASPPKYFAIGENKTTLIGYSERGVIITVNDYESNTVKIEYAKDIPDHVGLYEIERSEFLEVYLIVLQKLSLASIGLAEINLNIKE